MSSDWSLVMVRAHYDDLADDAAGSRYGSAYVFDGATGAQLAKLQAINGTIGDQFGQSLAVSSDGARVLVGANYDEDDDDAGTASGSAYVVGLPHTTSFTSADLFRDAAYDHFHSCFHRDHGQYVTHDHFHIYKYFHQGFIDHASHEHGDDDRYDHQH
ncbi:unnamed protein product [Prorocentrum cordatum]|uniref:Subtilisin n=1 Tax=Prorocentrum cordatum TaxID=2364126 RepID=A0ABN9TWQ5_9DINO|nr:unnamed protein product [Polarella glacialis]